MNDRRPMPTDGVRCGDCGLGLSSECSGGCGSGTTSERTDSK